MPCPHNEISIVQRSNRQSAVAAAAYQSGEKLFCEYDQQVKHYPEKRGIVHNEILLPANAPPEYADRNTLFEAYITNLGKYAEGQLVGETLKFPATTEEVQSLLKNIGVDGVRYEEFFITAFDGDVMGLYDYLTEYENLDELNHLAHLISELDSDEIETLEAVLNKGDHTSSVADIINLVHNLDCYELHPGVTDDETLGRIYVEDMELLDVPDNVLPYFDFEAYGRDMRINEGGHFAPTGYLTRSGDFKEVYHGIEDIPAEHRIFAYPKLNIREQMAAYKEVIDRSSLEGERLHPRKEHDDR